MLVGCSFHQNHQKRPGFEHEKVQLCATCQKMVRSETGSAGVMSGLPRSITEVVEEGGGVVSYVHKMQGWMGWWTVNQHCSYPIIPHSSQRIVSLLGIGCGSHFVMQLISSVLFFHGLWPEKTFRTTNPHVWDWRVFLPVQKCKNVRFWIFPTNEVINHLSKYIASHITTLFQPAEKSTNSNPSSKK